MTSLCPGPLFQTAGLNQHSTPTPPTATPSEIDRKLLRQPFNGHDWPRDSPVAGVYDIGNSSTSLVLLNKRRKKRTQLRGIASQQVEIIAPEPERHVPEEPTVNWEHHKNCLNSSSKPYKPRVNLDLGWVNTTQRPPVRFDSGSHVNHRRHTSCRVSGNNPVMGWTGMSRRPPTGASYGMDSELQAVTPLINDPDIPHGGRRYLYSIARIYSTSQMKQLKQDQYHQLLFKELSKGYHSPKEYERYLSYLKTPRKTQFGKLDNYDELKRSKSAPPPADSDTNPSGRGDTDRGDSRKQKRPTYSSHSWAPSMISSNSRVSSNSGRLSVPSRKGKKKGGPKRQKSPPPSSSREKPSKEKQRQSPEPGLGAPSEEDATDHPRKEEDETMDDDDALTEIKESEEDSFREKKSQSEADNADKKEDAAKVFLTPQKDGTSPRKGDEGMSPGQGATPRKGEEEGTAKKEDQVDAKMSEGQGSSDAAGTTNAASSSNTTSNNFLALIVSDAEKDDDSKTVESSEMEKQSMAEDSTADASAARDFSDLKPARGHSPRINKEGRTRPLSRAGRTTAIKDNKEKENSDDDYDDTDEETEPVRGETEKASSMEQTKEDTQQKEQQPVQTTTQLEAETAVDTSRTDETEERGTMEEDPTPGGVDQDKRAGSPEEGGDERACDNHETEGQRSLVIPVRSSTGQTSPSKAEVLDLSAENKNRDVDKLEY